MIINCLMFRFDKVRYVIAAGRTERGQVRKVRASQGRVPDNVRRR